MSFDILLTYGYALMRKLKMRSIQSPQNLSPRVLQYSKHHQYPFIGRLLIILKIFSP